MEPHEARPARRSVDALALAVVAGVAAVVRLIPLREALTDHGIRLIPDGDPYYHLIRAHRILAGHLDWFDRGMNFPYGAENPWPPAFDALLAAVSWLAAPFAGTPARRVELAGVFLPVAMGVVTVIAIAWLAREVLGRGALGAALLVAVLPSNFQYTHAGRADHHAVEALLLVAILIPLSRALRARDPVPRARAAAVAGAFLALAFWSWLGSAFHLALLALCAGMVHVVGPDDEVRARVASALAWAAATAAALLVVSLWVLGPPGALGSGRITGISGLSVAMCTAAALAAALLAARSRRPASRVVRALEALLAAALAAGVMALSPAIRSGIAHGLEALTRSNPWYRTIEEFQPMVLGGKYPVWTELLTTWHHLGLVPLLALAAIPGLATLWKAEPDRRAGVLLAACCALFLVPLALLRMRMNVYLAVPLALLAPEGVRWLAGRVPWRAPSRAAAAALYVVAIFPFVPTARALAQLPHAHEMEAAIRISERLRGWASAAAQDGGAGEGVLASWSRGHDVRYYSGLPVVTTPFGTEGGEGAMEDSARFLLAASQEQAEQVLARRQVRWILLHAPDPELLLGAELLAVPGMEVRQTFHGFVFPAPSPAAYQRVGSRLYYRYGIAEDGATSLDGFRLLDEDAGGSEGEPAKLFERVPGARLAVAGAAPLAPVEAVMEVRTPSGRIVPMQLRGAADAAGTATLRVPYASGANGRSIASDCFIRCGGRSGVVQIPERAVLRGEIVRTELR
jgi:hypothetical protein